MNSYRLAKAVVTLLAFYTCMAASYGADSAQSSTSTINELISHDRHSQLMVRLAGARYDEVSKCDVNSAYILDDRTEGYDSHRALILAAYMGGKELTFTLKGCVKGNPRIINVRI